MKYSSEPEAVWNYDTYKTSKDMFSVSLIKI